MAIYTKIQDDSTINLAAVKAFCRIDNDAFDVPLQLILDGVKCQADAYCQNNFTEYGGVVPPQVERWILKACLLDYERPNMAQTREDIWESGSNYYRTDPDFWDYYIEDLKPYRREPGF